MNTAAFSFCKTWLASDYLEMSIFTASQYFVGAQAWSSMFFWGHLFFFRLNSFTLPADDVVIVISWTQVLVFVEVKTACQPLKHWQLLGNCILNKFIPGHKICFFRFLRSRSVCSHKFFLFEIHYTREKSLKCAFNCSSAPKVSVVTWLCGFHLHIPIKLMQSLFLAIFYAVLFLRKFCSQGRRLSIMLEARKFIKYQRTQEAGPLALWPQQKVKTKD